MVVSLLDAVRDVEHHPGYNVQVDLIHPRRIVDKMHTNYFIFTAVPAH